MSDKGPGMSEAAKRPAPAEDKHLKKAKAAEVGPSNPGMELDMSWVNRAQVNLPALKRRADTHKVRRSVKKIHQAAWLLRATQCVDLTTLAGDDTDVNVARLCAKAKNPIRKDMLEAMGLNKDDIQVGAVCVY